MTVETTDDLIPADVEESKNKRVFVAIPAIADIAPEVVENLCAMFFSMGRRSGGYDFYLKIVGRKEQYRARNNLVNMALGVSADWILFLDDDMVVPNDLFDRLSAHDKDVCGALYFQRGGQYYPVIMQRVEGKDGFVNFRFVEDFPRKALTKVDVIGGGCMLIKTSVFKSMMEPYFWIDGIVGTDIAICERFREAKVEVWVDTSVELGHMTTGEVLTEKTLPPHRRFTGMIRERLLEDIMDYTGLGKDRIYDACARAACEDYAGIWDSRERKSWEGYKDYYIQEPDRQLLHLVYHQMITEQPGDYVVNRVDPYLLKRILPGENILDFGAGSGMYTIAMAENGFNVRSVDLVDSPYQEFVKWRVKKHNLNVDFGQVLDFNEWTPNVFAKWGEYHAVLMLGVFDHLPNPFEVLERIHRSMAIGGLLIMDVSKGKSALQGQPQHIMAFDPGTVNRKIEKLGFKQDNSNEFIWERL